MTHYKMADEDAQGYHCSYCGCDITLRLKCNVCHDFDLCLHCFASGALGGTHAPDHPYQLIDEGSFPLLTDDWGAIEEVLLLDAVEQDGFGNWEDIGAHVVTKTARESKDHYNDVYINSVIGDGLIPQDHHIKALEGVGGEIPPSPPLFTPVILDHSEQQELTYMPLRDDFEKEFDNDSEKIISTLGTYHDEEDIERDLKLAHIDMYTRRLSEREKRKSFARQHNLISGKQRNFKRKYSKEERELRNKYRPLARLIEYGDYEKLIASLKRERELKERIQDLKRYRSYGITKLEDSVEIDLLKQEQDKLKDSKKENEASFEDDGTLNTQGTSEVLAPLGLTLLSQSERKLCNTLVIKPQEYLNIKSEVLKVAALRHKGIAAKPSLPKALSQETKHHIIKYFYKSGWLS